MSAKPKTFYEILDVPNTASENEIKKAFRTLSLKFHPDRNKAPDAQSTFQTINEAYETLSDPAKRNQYDMELKGGVFPGMFPGAPDDIGNIFNMMFGHGFPGMPGGMPRGMPGGHGIHIFHGPGGIHHVNINRGGMDNNQHIFMQKPEPIVKHIRVSLEQSYLGCSFPIEVERWILRNDVKHTETETIYVPIHRGIDENEMIILEGKGNVVNDIIRGDIKINIQMENKTIFRRQGLDLLYTKTLTLKEALCGFNMELQHLNGKKVVLSNNTNRAIVAPNSKKVINELGMFRNNTTGNLIIDFVVQFPEHISDENVQRISELLP
jgi:DnaJ-class molecular chaperone